MGEKGEVIAVTEDHVTVRLKRTEACARCGACGMVPGGEEMRVEAENACGAQVNDIVQVELKPEAFLSAVAIMYGLPLIGLAAGCGVGYWLGLWLGLRQYAALTGFLMGLAFTGIVFFIIKKHESVWREKGYTPVATKVEQP